MTMSHDAGTLDIPGNVTREEAGDIAAAIAKFGVMNATDAYLPFASHVGAVILAVARTINDGEGSLIGAQDAVACLDHTCGVHLEAALWLLAKGFVANDMDARDVVKAVASYMDDALRA